MAKATQGGRPAAQGNGPTRPVLMIVDAHAIGETALQRVLERLPVGAPPVRINGAALSAVLLARLLPDLVIAPLIRGRGDASETARELHGMGFAGVLVVAAPPLPAPDLVAEELRAAAPGLRIVLMAG